MSGSIEPGRIIEAFGNNNDVAARDAFVRRQQQWLFEDRYGPTPEPEFTEEEARTIRRQHIAVRALSDPFFAGPPEGRVYCVACGQPWKDGGCSIIRLLHQWHARGEDNKQLQERNRSMAEFLAEWWARREVYPSPGYGRIAQCSLKVDGYMLEKGKMLVVDQLLLKMREQWKHYLEQLFPPSQMEVAARAFNESLANIEREKRRAQADATGDGE